MRNFENRILMVFQDLDSNTILAKPAIFIAPEIESQRPELELFNLQETQLETSKEVISKSNYPKLFGFAQAGYGNPGLNMLDNSFPELFHEFLTMEKTAEIVPDSCIFCIL